VLKDEFFTVRCRAARALGKLGDRKTIPVLLNAQKEDPSEEVQKEATLALKKLNAKK
jgi:HEAT repeat protein